jgi:hypothetical protein
MPGVLGPTSDMILFFASVTNTQKFVRRRPFKILHHPKTAVLYGRTRNERSRQRGKC